MKIYTKTGDQRETDLWCEERVSKDAPRVEAYGTVDELNAVLGMSLNNIQDTEVRSLVQSIQSELFIVGADLATPEKSQIPAMQRVSESLCTALEKVIDRFNESLPALRHFILPCGTPAAALLHFARTVCRRAERRVVTLSHVENINPQILIYLNRLSDLLFVLARYENWRSGPSDQFPEIQRSQVQR
jgi:cob(I)alamin adenosyltransferase